jgi:hypothetical protein
MSVFFIRVWVDGDSIVAVRTGEGLITDAGDYGNATFIDAVAEGAYVDAGTLRPTLTYANNVLSSSLVTLLPAKDVTALLAQSGYGGQAVYNWADGNQYQWNGNPWGATSTSRETIARVIGEEIVGGPDAGLSIPSQPSAIGAVGGYQQITLQWSLPTTNADGSPLDDFARFNVYRNTVDDFETATLIGSSSGQTYVDAGLGNEEVYFYWVTTVDFTVNESAPSTSATSTTDFISAADMVADIRDEIGAARIDVVSSLPSTTGYNAGDFVYLTSDGKLYQFNGTAWVLAVTAVEAVDISGELQTAQIAVDAITEDLIAANAVTATKIEDGSISTPKIVTGAVTAGTIATGAITAVKIATNAVTADKIIADAITANKIATNAVTTDALAANSVTADQLTTNSVTTGKIEAGAVSASKIAVDNLAAIQANLGAITAGSINTVSGGIGLQVNIPARPNAVYAFGNQELIYALYGENTYVPPGTTAAGGAVKIRSNSGYGLEIDQYGDYSGEQAAAFIQNSQDIGSGPRGGAVYLGRGFTEGNYGVEVLRGGYYDTSGDGYLPFTGSHEAILDKATDPQPGDILYDIRSIVTGLSDSLTEVGVSFKPNQPSAVGVFKGYKDSWNNVAAFIDREATAKNFSRCEKEKTDMPCGKPKKVYKDGCDIYQDDYNLLVMNSLGEGGINVCGEGGDIQPGDLIVTSSTPGKGMRQADDVIRSCTVAKAREAVTFSNASDVKMVACIYLCG